ncbi:MAG: biopolymer transporter ExbD [Rhodocyclales bacterium]|nr:biopolymer transporter ExbD [Rhodocyclales bacterium]
MAFGGFSQEGRGAPMSEINMVPLIDVMLVLLIVFMITAPLLTHAIGVDLPRATSLPSRGDNASITLAIDAEGVLYWNDEAIAPDALEARLAEAATRTPQPELHLRADRDTRYQALATLMAQAQRAGIRTIGFVTLPEAATLPGSPH